MPLFWNVSKIPDVMSGINTETNMKIKVTKLTNVDRLRKANSFTTGRDSKMSLKTAYRLGHSPIRSQRFDIELYDIPLFVASQLVRQKIGVDWYMRSKRTDRGGADFKAVCADLANDLVMAFNQRDHDEIDSIAQDIAKLPNQFDRYAPTDLYAQDINAEALINMAHKRLCTMASKETREIVEHICALVEEQDPELAKYLVRPCVAHGVCREAKPCGYIKTQQYAQDREGYLDNIG